MCITSPPISESVTLSASRRLVTKSLSFSSLSISASVSSLEMFRMRCLIIGFGSVCIPGQNRGKGLGCVSIFIPGGYCIVRVALHLWQRSVSISPLVNSFLWTTAHSCFWSLIPSPHFYRRQFCSKAELCVHLVPVCHRIFPLSCTCIPSRLTHLQSDPIQKFHF